MTTDELQRIVDQVLSGELSTDAATVQYGVHFVLCITHPDAPAVGTMANCSPDETCAIMRAAIRSVETNAAEIERTARKEPTL